VERCHGVADTTSPIVGIAPESVSGQISSIDDLGSLSPGAAVCADTDTLAAPASCTTDYSTDFRTNRHSGDGFADHITLNATG
jgi:hypothetical protein